MNKEKMAIRVVAGLGIFVFALILADYKRSQAITNKRNEIAEWPNFVSRDISGRTIRGSDYLKHVRYVQFLGPADDNNIDLLKSVYAHWADNIAIFVIVRNYQLIRARSEDGFAKAIIIQDQNDELFNKFKATKYGKHYIFRRNGATLFSAENNVRYDSGARRYLQLAVNNRQFHISEFIREKDNIKDIPEFDQITNVLEQGEKDHLLIGMISSFCESCASGSLVEIFKRFNIRNDWKKSVILILSNEYTESDLEVFRSQLRVEYTILIANPALNRRWQELINTYSKNEVNNIVFTVDRAGNIDRVLDSLCQSCEESFWKWIANKSSD